MTKDELKGLIYSMKTRACMDRSGDDQAHEELKDLLLRGAQSLEQLQAKATSEGTAANKASAKARKQRSDAIVDTIARILLENEAYRDLSNRALADLLNRRKILTGWQRPWTSDGLKRHRKYAEERIEEWAEIGTPPDETPPDETVALRRALTLAEHDQIDFLHVCREAIKEVTDPGVIRMRTMRADAVAQRLQVTRDALARQKGK